MNHKILFLDMDGTMAMFYEQSNCLEQMWQPNFFAGLKPYANLIEAIKLLHKEGIELCVISAIHQTHFGMVATEKKRWLYRYLPEIFHEQSRNVIFVDVNESKAATISSYAKSKRVAMDQCYLLDDYNKNLQDWRKHGGKPIKFVNEINDKGMFGPLWDGQRIRYDYEPERIAKELTTIMKGAAA